MPHASDLPQRVLRHWFAAPAAAIVQPVARQGAYSGARLFRVECAGTAWALKGRLADDAAAAERNAAIHRLQRFLREAGIRQTSCPVPARSGATSIEEEGAVWELAPWLPGAATYRADPSPGKLASALDLLARVHVAAAALTPEGRRGPSPGLQRRAARLAALQSGGAETLRRGVHAAADDLPRELLEQLLTRLQIWLQRGPRPVAADAATALPLQWCLRDVRWEHVLFDGQQAVGLIDFAAAEVETVACDLGRLRGDAPGGAPPAWEDALRSYAQRRPLESAEQAAIGWFAESGAPLAAANWLQWLVVERRWRDDRAALQSGRERLEELMRLWPADAELA
jgi:homoserine kinase type II